MSYQIQLVTDHNMVRICHEGIVDASEMNICKESAIIHLKRFGWNRVLIDLTRADFQLRAMDIAVLFRDLDNKFSDGAFIAVLPPAKMVFDYVQYSKSIATEWSNTKIEIFNQGDLAIMWLAEQ